MSFPNQRDPLGYSQRRAKGCSPGLLMFVMLGFFVFWMVTKARDNPQPSMPDGRQESQGADNSQGGVPFPDVLPSGSESTERVNRDWSIDSSSPTVPRPNISSRSNNSNRPNNSGPNKTNGDWSIDTDVGTGSGAELQLEPAGSTRGGETKRGDWSIDTDVRKD